MEFYCGKLGFIGVKCQYCRRNRVDGREWMIVWEELRRGVMVFDSVE